MLKQSLLRGGLRSRCRGGRFGFRAAEPPHGVRTDAPEDDRIRSLGFLGLAILALVLRADEVSVNEDMVAFLERVRDGLAEAVEGHDAVPLGFRLPLVVRALPRLLRTESRTDVDLYGRASLAGEMRRLSAANGNGLQGH